MDGVFFLMAIVATGLVMWWVIQNDHAGPEEKTKGLFAMTDAAPQKAKSKRTGRFRDVTESSHDGPGRP